MTTTAVRASPVSLLAALPAQVRAEPELHLISVHCVSGTFGTELTRRQRAAVLCTCKPLSCRAL